MRCFIVAIYSFALLNFGATARAFSSATPVPRSSNVFNTLLANKKICIAGGGPSGIYLASLLIQQEPTVQITILEKNERGSGSVNAFGIGLGTRLVASLDALPGLKDRVQARAARIANSHIAIISRANLSEQMTRFLEERDQYQQCQIRFGEGCQDIDLDAKQVLTTQRRKVDYDLLIGADGIRSTVREALVQQRNLQEEHFLYPTRWKALRLPPQPDFDAGSFQSVQHVDLTAGRILPRYPEGHILLLFWNSETDNPGNVTSSDDLQAMLTDALQDEKKGGFIWRFLGARKNRDGDGLTRKKRVVFDDRAVELFLRTRPGRSHHMKIERFHHDSVALIGDAAHGMSSLLGQGCACGLKSAQILAGSLLGIKTNKDDDDKSSHAVDLNTRLREYSDIAVPNAHAITDLNLIGYIRRAGPLTKALALPLTLIQMVRGKSLFRSLSQVDVSYEQLLRENRWIIALCRQKWKNIRVPLDNKRKATKALETARDTN